MENPSLVYRLPCEWNVQLNGKSRSVQCYTKTSNPKVYFVIFCCVCGSESIGVYVSLLSLILILIQILFTDIVSLLYCLIIGC